MTQNPVLESEKLEREPLDLPNGSMEQHVPPQTVLGESCFVKVVAGRVVAPGAYNPSKTSRVSCISLPNVLFLKEKCHRPSGIAIGKFQKR